MDPGGLPDIFPKFFGNSVRFYFLDGRRSRSGPEHRINDRVIYFLNIIQVIEGNFYYQFEGEERQYLSGGRVLLIPADIRHSVGMAEGEGSIRWADVQVVFLDVLGMDQLFEYPRVLNETEGHRIGSAIEQLAVIKKRRYEKGIRDIVACQKFGFDILYIIMKYARLKPEASGLLKGIQRLYPALKFIENNLINPLSREEIASRLNLSVNRCHVLFKESTGMAPMEYVSRKRLEKAQIIMAETDKTLQEIASELRYYDAFHFSKSFKKAFGITPSDYRKRVRMFLSEAQE